MSNEAQKTPFFIVLKGDLGEIYTVYREHYIFRIESRWSRSGWEREAIWEERSRNLSYLEKENVGYIKTADTGKKDNDTDQKPITHQNQYQTRFQRQRSLLNRRNQTRIQNSKLFLGYIEDRKSHEFEGKYNRVAIYSENFTIHDTCAYLGEYSHKEETILLMQDLPPLKEIQLIVITSNPLKAQEIFDTWLVKPDVVFKEVSYITEISNLYEGDKTIVTGIDSLSIYDMSKLIDANCPILSINEINLLVQNENQSKSELNIIFPHKSTDPDAMKFNLLFGKNIITRKNALEHLLAEPKNYSYLRKILELNLVEAGCGILQMSAQKGIDNFLDVAVKNLENISNYAEIKPEEALANFSLFYCIRFGKPSTIIDDLRKQEKEIAEATFSSRNIMDALLLRKGDYARNDKFWNCLPYIEQEELTHQQMTSLLTIHPGYSNKIRQFNRRKYKTRAGWIFKERELARLTNFDGNYVLSKFKRILKRAEVTFEPNLSLFVILFYNNGFEDKGFRNLRRYVIDRIKRFLKIYSKQQPQKYFEFVKTIMDLSKNLEASLIQYQYMKTRQDMPVLKTGELFENIDEGFLLANLEMLIDLTTNNPSLSFLISKILKNKEQINAFISDLELDQVLDIYTKLVAVHSHIYFLDRVYGFTHVRELMIGLDNKITTGITKKNKSQIQLKLAKDLPKFIHKIWDKFDFEPGIDPIVMAVLVLNDLMIGRNDNSEYYKWVKLRWQDLVEEERQETLVHINKMILQDEKYAQTYAIILKSLNNDLLQDYPVFDTIQNLLYMEEPIYWKIASKLFDTLSNTVERLDVRVLLEDDHSLGKSLRDKMREEIIKDPVSENSLNAMVYYLYGTKFSELDLVNVYKSEDMMVPLLEALITSDNKYLISIESNDMLGDFIEREGVESWKGLSKEAIHRLAGFDGKASLIANLMILDYFNEMPEYEILSQLLDYEEYNIRETVCLKVEEFASKNLDVRYYIPFYEGRFSDTSDFANELLKKLKLPIKMRRELIDYLLESPFEKVNRIGLNHFRELIKKSKKPPVDRLNRLLEHPSKHILSEIIQYIEEYYDDLDQEKVFQYCKSIILLPNKYAKAKIKAYPILELLSANERLREDVQSLLYEIASTSIIKDRELALTLLVQMENKL